MNRRVELNKSLGWVTSKTTSRKCRETLREERGPPATMERKEKTTTTG